VDVWLLETLSGIAGAAGRLVLEMYGSAPLLVEYKGPADPVTAADRRANALIVDRLEQAFPGIPVVAEESAPASFERFREAKRVLFVDPLDGTREFMSRNGEFAVMIGLVEGSRAVAGVVHAPVTGITWLGAVTVGAWRAGPGVEGQISLHVSRTGALAQSRIVASRSHRSARLERALASLGVRDVCHMGSAGLKGAQVAEGFADAYVDTGTSTKRWDACAIDALVTAAGGRVSDLTGEPIDYRAPGLANERGLIVSNGRTHAAIVARLAEHAAPEQR
jgi:3'(2'), 5'-bisphosphate nucleotidase